MQGACERPESRELPFGRSLRRVMDGPRAETTEEGPGGAGSASSSVTSGVPEGLGHFFCSSSVIPFCSLFSVIG